MTRIDDCVDRMETYIQKQDFRGWDPYDGLMAPYWNWPLLKTSSRLRWAWQQAVKRCPINVRPALGVRKGRNPVTLALFVQGLVYRDMIEPSDDRRTIVTRIVDELNEMITPGWSGACWGYDFAWESRYATRPPGYPTVVATGFVVNALYSVYRQWGIPLAKELIAGAAVFVKNDLNRTHDNRGFCWSYSPCDDRAVINATMKGARICAQAFDLGAGAEFAKLAEATTSYVATRQGDDGSWPYSANDDRTWVDHFHTGYVLECMNSVIGLCGLEWLEPKMKRGLEFYIDSFFEHQVVPRYYADSLYPIDATACAQAIITLLTFGMRERAASVADWSIDNLCRLDGCVYYQVHKRWTNRQIFMRWSVAWMYVALCRLGAELTDTTREIIGSRAEGTETRGEAGEVSGPEAQ